MRMLIVVAQLLWVFLKGLVYVASKWRPCYCLLFLQPRWDDPAG
jgi:hypothetical protein